MQEVKADLNVKRTELENSFTPKLTSLEEEKLLIETDVELWAVANKEDLASKRSWDVLHGSFGFRQSQKIKPSKKFTWADVLEKLKEAGGKFKTYVRVKEEVAKDELKADINDGNITLDDAVKKCGVMIETIDNFFIEPNTIEVN